MATGTTCRMGRYKGQWPAKVFSWSTLSRGQRSLDCARYFKLRVSLLREPDRIIEVRITESEAPEIRDRLDRWINAKPFEGEPHD